MTAGKQADAENTKHRYELLLAEHAAVKERAAVDASDALDRAKIANAEIVTLEREVERLRIENVRLAGEVQSLIVKLNEVQP